MSHSAPTDIDCKSPPFDHFRGIHRLAVVRGGHASGTPARHQLYVARDKRTRANVLIKVTSKTGVVYEQDLVNEIASLSTINHALPNSPYFPVLGEHGRLPDGRMYLSMSCFDEWPLAKSIGVERMPSRHVGYLRTTIEVLNALVELHELKIWHVDLNPMNILFRWERSKPVIRIVDFESSYEVARHAAGVFYNPPTTSGYSAPELSRQAPDARSDLFSLGAVLYSMIAGLDWTWTADIGTCLNADCDLARELKQILLTAVDADPDRRYASCLELRAALAAHLEHIWPGRSW
jgi:serine/threonine protein kinase